MTDLVDPLSATTGRSRARSARRSAGRCPVAAGAADPRGALPLLAVAAFGGGDVSRPAAAAVLAWIVLTVGASSGRRGAEKIRWAQPPLVRATEYAALIWIAALEGPDAYPAAFALLAALTFRHYDLNTARATSARRRRRG